MKDVSAVAKTGSVRHDLLTDCTVPISDCDIMFECLINLGGCGYNWDVLHRTLLPDTLFKGDVHNVASVRRTKNDTKDSEDIVRHAITVR